MLSGKLPPGRILSYEPARPAASQQPAQSHAPQTDPETKTAIVGPTRALFGSTVAKDIEVPACDVTRAPVLLARNDSKGYKCVEIRLARRATASTIALFPSPTAQFVPTTGGFVPANGMSVDLRGDGQQHVDLLLGPGDQLWAIGIWPGTVPRSIYVTVLEYNQGE